MKARTMYAYHLILALWLNWRASRASQVLRTVGARSNWHEAQRDRWRVVIEGEGVK